MKYQKTNFLLPLIIISNLFPLYGVIKFNWTIFSIVYIYWLELLIISGFQLLKIFISQGDPKANFFSKSSIAIKFFLFRSGVFFFYLIFIIVFLGIVVSGDNKSENVMFARTLTLQEPFFKVVLLNFLAYNFVEFLVVFLLMKEYKTSLPNDHFVIFDSHMIVVHVVVVLGTFLYQFVLKHFHADHRSAMIACVCLFIFVKICVDLARQAMNNKAPKEMVGEYI